MSAPETPPWRLSERLRGEAALEYVERLAAFYVQVTAPEDDAEESPKALAARVSRCRSLAAIEVHRDHRVHDEAEDQLPTDVRRTWSSLNKEIRAQRAELGLGEDEPDEDEDEI